MEIPLIGKIILYVIIVMFGIICIILCGWQLMVLRGKSMKNPDGSVDDWHEQKLFYGIAIADITIAVPVTLIGIILILLNWRIGYYLTGLACFWYLWANIRPPSLLSSVIGNKRCLCYRMLIQEESHHSRWRFFV